MNLEQGGVSNETAELGCTDGNANGPVLYVKTPNTVLNQQAVNDLGIGSLSGSTKNPTTGLQGLVLRTGVPRKVPAIPNPSAAAEDFANRFF